MLQVFENGDLVVHRQNRVLVAPQEFLLEDLDCCIIFSVDLAAQVDLAGVALAERLENFVLLVEDGVLLSLSLWLLLSLHFV